MAPIRVIKGFREALKRTTSNIGMPTVAGPVMPNSFSTRTLQYECHSPPGNQPNKAFASRGIKKSQGRIRRTSRFCDHGSTTSFTKVLRRRRRVAATSPRLPSSPPISSNVRPQSPPGPQRYVPTTCQPPNLQRPTGPRPTVREARFAEKHLDVPFSIYLACKSLNTPPYRGPVKSVSVERQGRDTRRSRHVPLAWAKGSPFRGCKRRGVFMQSLDGFVPRAVFDRESGHDSPLSPPSPRTGFDVEEVQSLFSLCTINAVPPAPSSESSDEVRATMPIPMSGL
ncbi:hypothetical protein GSI_15451 [Ganoderma sinense ZZ0214-1]|uniref:Uncharacterized protein n=1 Tax=Ganoderma sinense ZZ0214-1 TaxID=1077348 RepID=A0A2G8RML2_9APHY|nr:hypothetical protein GSI_15451 [Ganoderma sinense ZZ0214-1]